MRTVHLLPFCFLKGQSDLFSFHSKDFFFFLLMLCPCKSQVLFLILLEIFTEILQIQENQNGKKAKKTPKHHKNLIFSPKIFIKENTQV